jgi:RNA polymerase sigma-70 factor (ECF subfamily)
MSSDAADASWLARFHDGERDVLEGCYREHFATVTRAVGRILRGADQETVVHEVFLRMLSDAGFRGAFHGGNLGAWLTTVARNHAIDFLRRLGREEPLDGHADQPVDLEGALEARLLVERFRREVLPAKWERVFQVRFLEQQDQRAAAAALGIQRTTLAYQELRVRRLLQRFLLRMVPS